MWYDFTGTLINKDEHQYVIEVSKMTKLEFPNFPSPPKGIFAVGKKKKFYLDNPGLIQSTMSGYSMRIKNWIRAHKELMPDLEARLLHISNKVDSIIAERRKEEAKTNKQEA
jgi:hypothetical protein